MAKRKFRTTRVLPTVFMSEPPSRAARHRPASSPKAAWKRRPVLPYLNRDADYADRLDDCQERPRQGTGTWRPLRLIMVALVPQIQGKLPPGRSGAVPTAP